MRLDARRRELLHDEGVDLVVRLALLLELFHPLAIECAGIVPIVHDQEVGIVRGVHGLGLAPVEFLFFFHHCSLC